MGKISNPPAGGETVRGNPDALDEFWRKHGKCSIRRQGTVGEARRTLTECQIGYDATWFLYSMRGLAEDTLLDLPDHLLPFQNSAGYAVEETLRGGFRRECFERLERTLIVVSQDDKILYANMYAIQQMACLSS